MREKQDTMIMKFNYRMDIVKCILKTEEKDKSRGIKKQLLNCKLKSRVDLNVWNFVRTVTECL